MHISRTKSPRNATFQGLYAPLIAYLAQAETEIVTLTFAQIEALIGVSLSLTAQSNSSFWASRLQQPGLAWRAIGWEARLDRGRDSVTWRRRD